MKFNPDMTTRRKPKTFVSLCGNSARSMLQFGEVSATALVTAVLSVSALCADGADTYAPIQPFLELYCVECHGPEKQKAEVRLDDLGAIDGALWIKIFEQIDYGDMPPEDELQPSDEERTRITKLVDQLSWDDALSIATGYRRLNRREYANTVRDLLGLKSGIYDPAARIFQDEIDHGFDTNAEELVISNELLLEYLDSAERSLRMALFLKSFEVPVTQTVPFNPATLVGGNRRYTTRKTKDKSIIMRGPADQFAKEPARRVAVAGNYRVTITAAGVDRDNYGKLKFAPAQGPIKMAVGARLDGGDGAGGASELVKIFDLEDEKFASYQVEMWLPKGASPWVSFHNGSKKPAASVRAAIRRRQLKPANSPKNYQGPGVEITRFIVEGPIDPEWPPATYRTIFRENRIPDFENAAVRDALLVRFLSRSLRRPATEVDIQDYRVYLDQQHEKTGNWQDAIIRTFAAVMSSHDFLYIKEEVGELPPFALANRLSYFLWSTMPDLDLFRLALSGEILNDQTYAAQVERMLDDERIDEFVRSFATQWLSLDVLGTMAPDNKDKQYGIYHKRGFEPAFRNETLHFFRHVLFENQPVGDFLDSDYTFLNSTLAQAYNLPFEGGPNFERVSLPAGSVRGGLLGHGSILSLTSNGVETLPVTRGHWVLDELLGTPPPPPPAEVPALVPDLTGVDTPRDQLARHREDAACFNCHQKMDPIGLALENFDVIGRFREKYNPKTKIDPAGEMYGTRFESVAELRKILRTREQEFAKNLTIKLAEYAKGRQLNRRDFEIVDQVVAEAAKDDYRFKTLLRQILLSKLMRDR